MRIIECVPNFSEGLDQAKIDRIAAALENVSNVKLLHVDSGIDANRTVMTFAGFPEAVVEAAFQSIATAAQLIDMQQHNGVHPRLGATDVCPLIPVSGVTMTECVRFAKSLGQRVAQELGIPVYLYEKAAQKPERRNLAAVRKGEYEYLSHRLKDPAWQPDYGPAQFNSRAGATVIGARSFLIAYNVTLDTNDQAVADEIAGIVRESGRFERNAGGELVTTENGQRIRIPGKLRACKAIGWMLEEYDRAQVSMNLTDFNITPLHVAYETVKKQADKFSVEVLGSEIIGLCPLQALLDSGRYYLKSKNPPEEQLINAAIKSLHLNHLNSFHPEKKILDYLIAQHFAH